MIGRPSVRLKQSLSLSLPVSCGMEKRSMLWPLIAQKCAQSGLQELLSPRAVSYTHLRAHETLSDL
eukprot:7780747-Karenia_brevis.AAC.1